MKYMTKIIAVAVAFGAMTGCEAWREQAEARGLGTIAQDGGAEQDDQDCDGCRRKWSAKPQGGVNAPPWGM
jgi:hypothetical protein